MTDRDTVSDAAAHKVADALLPWFVNGTLDPDERAFVERHVAQCPACRGDVEYLRNLHAACVAAERLPDAGAARTLRRHLEASRPAPARPLAAWRWALAGGFVAFVALAGAWIAGEDPGPSYRTLGAGAPGAAARAAIVVVFDPATTEFDLRRIVRAANARIVDGPTQTNAYVLDVPAERREQAVQTLRAERVVVLAERLDAGAPR